MIPQARAMFDIQCFGKKQDTVLPQVPSVQTEAKHGCQSSGPKCMLCHYICAKSPVYVLQCSPRYLQTKPQHIDLIDQSQNVFDQRVQMECDQICSIYKFDRSL